MMRSRRSPVVARKLRAILRTPATGNNTEVELLTENDGPLLTEQAWVSSWDATGSVLETEADHA